MQILRAFLAIVFAFVCLSINPAQAQTRHRPAPQPSSPPAAMPKRPVTITVRNGNPLVGNFIQADANIIQIEINGVSQRIRVDDVISLAFINSSSPTQAEMPQAITPQSLVNSEYDAAKDETQVALLNLKVYADSRHALTMGVVATYKGRNPESLPAITIIFLSASDNWQYERIHGRDGSGKGTLRILVNGVQLSLLDKSYDTYRQTFVDKGQAIERMSATLYRLRDSELSKLTTAQRIDIQLAYTQFALNNEQTAAVREFVRRITPD